MSFKKILPFLLVGLALSYWAYNRYGTNFIVDEPNGIQFHRGIWAEAQELAKKEQKIIFLDIYATWCGPCKKMKKNTFSNAKVGTVFNDRFINVSLNGEEPEGATLVNNYQVRAYPTMLFLNPDGKIIGTAQGYHNPEQLMEMVEQIK